MSALFTPGQHASWIPPVAPVAPALPPRLLLVGDPVPEPSPSAGIAAEVAAQGWARETVPLDATADPLSRREQLRRLTAAYDALASSPPPSQAGAAPIWVIASGYGAYLCTLLSQRRPIARMLLHAPTVYPDAGWDTPRSVLDTRAIPADHPAETAPNDNLAFCAASEYLGQILILEDISGMPGPHGLHVDYFHAFSRARSRHLETLVSRVAGAGAAAEPSRAAIPAATETFAQRAARWLKATP